jgi:hypothetical protein
VAEVKVAVGAMVGVTSARAAVVRAAAVQEGVD